MKPLGKAGMAAWVAIAFSCGCASAHAADRFTLTAGGDKCAKLFSSLGASSGPTQASPANASMANVKAVLGGYVAQANERARAPQVIGITFDRKSPDKAYALQFGAETEYFALKDIKKIALRINEKMGSGGSVYWVPSGFPTQAKASAFESSLSVQLARLPSQPRLRSIETLTEASDGRAAVRYATVSELPETLFLPGAKIKSVSKAEPIAEGSYKGWYRVIVNFTVDIGNGVKSFAVSMLIKSGEVAREVVRFMTHWQAAPLAKDATGAMVIARIEHAMQTKYPKLRRDDIGFMLQEEFADSYLVLLDHVRQSRG
ncbi:MAG: hypothetical protein WKG03_01310 [Telluria sp.]